jgi:hypothetical protein
MLSVEHAELESYKNNSVSYYTAILLPDYINELEPEYGQTRKKLKCPAIHYLSVKDRCCI